MADSVNPPERPPFPGDRVRRETWTACLPGRTARLGSRCPVMLLRAYLRSASAPSSTRIRYARSMALAMVHARAIQIWPNASGRTRISRDAITYFGWRVNR